jgi:alpha-L-fucosidase
MSCKRLNQDKIKPGMTASDSLEMRLAWFQEAKFGMFIHWGPYSRLAGEWESQTVPVGENAEWIMKNLRIPVDKYRDMARNFNPADFDPDEWISLAKNAGMKYIVITAKHHDGFAMYHSKVSSYNIFDHTSFRRDPLKELSDACADQDIKFCLYYSHREDWDHPGGYGNDWEYDNDWGSDIYNLEKFGKYLEEKAKPQIRELLTYYGPIGLVWFDRGMYTERQAREFVDLIHRLQPSALVNSRVGHYNQESLGDYQSMNDNGMPPGGLEEYWETPQTLNKTWGYSKFDTLWMSSGSVILRLAEIVSRGGNYLLNVGPDGNGKIPEKAVKILTEVGNWVSRNAESIYGTAANPFGKLPWGYCTKKENKLYAFVRDWPEDGSLILPGLKNNVTSAYLLKDKSVKLSATGNGRQTNISLPAKAPDTPASVVVIETEGLPEVVKKEVTQDEKGILELNYLTASTYGNAVTRFNRKGGFHISKWKEPQDSVVWSVRIKKPGKFKLVITYAANEEWLDKPYLISVDNHVIEKKVIPTGGLFEYRFFPIGYIEFPEEGVYSLTIRPDNIDEDYLMYLLSLTLSPENEIKSKGWGAN